MTGVARRAVRAKEEAARERLKFVDAKLLAKVRTERARLLDIRLNADPGSREEQFPPLREAAAQPTPGVCRVVLRMEIPKRSETVLDLGDDYKVAATDELLARIEQIFGARVAVLR